MSSSDASLNDAQVPDYLNSFADAMCELLTESLSDTDEDISHQNMSNAFLHIVTSYHIGTTLELCVTEEELGRVGLSCHFAVDCLCDNWNMSSVPGDKQ